MLTDLTEAELADYRSSQTMPADFDALWQQTLDGSRAKAQPPIAVPSESPLETVRVWDVEFSGFDGQRIRAWLRMPASGPTQPCGVVEYVGYGGGRGRAEDSLLWASSGFAHLVMDTRGQGAVWSVGATPDDGAAGPAVPGFLTRGVQDIETFYYRRLIADAVLAVDAMRSLPMTDLDGTAVLGASQGGGLTLAVAGLVPDLRAAFAFVPFLCDFPRAIRITDSDPYREVGRFLATHRESSAAVLETLSYVDGVNFSRRTRVPIDFSAALMDPVCPPSTVFGAFHAGDAPRRMTLWPWNGHEGGALDDQLRAIATLRDGRFSESADDAADPSRNS